jgi:hypothetical protein
MWILRSKNAKKMAFPRGGLQLGLQPPEEAYWIKASEISDQKKRVKRNAFAGRKLPEGKITSTQVDFHQTASVFTDE